MAEIVNMPKLGFDMAEGTLVRWMIQEGEQVSRGAVLAEIETDKATVEVEASLEGVMLRHLVGEGTVVPVNTPIAVVGAAGEKVDVPEPAGEAPSETETTILSPEKVAQATPEPAALSKPGALTEEAGRLPGSLRASPLARRMADEIGLDLQRVKGSGPGGRITKVDIEAYQAELSALAIPKAEAPPPPLKPAAPVLPVQPFLGSPPPESESIPLNRLRVIIGKRMVEAKQQLPHFYITHEYDVQALLDLRKEINLLIPEDQKISVNDFIIKAAALALRQFPNLNASLAGDHVIRHGQVNIGVAVAVEGGLLTIVCRDADRKPLRQVAVEVREMANRARSGKVRPGDIEGSTFSVSNLGMYDVESFIAIINPPEAAILAVGSANQVPVVRDDAIVPGWRMKATLSVDHRVSDGAEGARYMQALENYIQEPLRLLV